MERFRNVWSRAFGAGGGAGVGVVVDEAAVLTNLLEMAMRDGGGEGEVLEKLPLTRNWLEGLPMRTVMDKERENARLAKEATRLVGKVEELTESQHDNIADLKSQLSQLEEISTGLEKAQKLALSLQNQLVDLTHHVSVAEKASKAQILEDFRRDQAASFEAYRREKLTILSEKRRESITRLADFERERLKVLAESGVSPSLIRPKIKHNPEITSKELAELEIKDEEEEDLDGFFGGGVGGSGASNSAGKQGLRSAVSAAVSVVETKDKKVDKKVETKVDKKVVRRPRIVMEDEDFEDEPALVYGKGKGKTKKK